MIKNVYILGKLCKNFYCPITMSFSLCLLHMDNLTSGLPPSDQSKVCKSKYHHVPSQCSILQVHREVPISCLFHLKFCLLECYFLSIGFHQGQRHVQQLKSANIQSYTGNLPNECLNNPHFKANMCSTLPTRHQDSNDQGQTMIF